MDHILLLQAWGVCGDCCFLNAEKQGSAGQRTLRSLERFIQQSSRLALRLSLLEHLPSGVTVHRSSIAGWGGEGESHPDSQSPGNLITLFAAVDKGIFGRKESQLKKGCVRIIVAKKAWWWEVQAGYPESGQEVRPTYKISKLALSDTLPPSRPHILKIPQPA